MQIRTDIGRVQVVRSPWTVLAMGVLSAALCLGVGTASAWLLHDKPDGWFLYLFSGSFLLAGLFIVVTLPRVYTQVQRDKGGLVFEADPEGVGTSQGFGQPARRWPWKDISEIVVAERVKTVEQGETGHESNMTLVFLTKESKLLGWIDRARNGLQTSALRRRYVSTPHPRGHAAELVARLRSVAPGRIQIRHVQQAVFDHRRSADEFDP
jgi:hypothetical protein